MDNTKWTNKDKIKQFGTIHYNMDKDAPSDCLDPRLREMNNYIDKHTVKRWVMARMAEGRRDKLSVLDVGAGKGRMTRYFLEWAKDVVAIEPFDHFCETLQATSKAEGRSLEVHRSTLNEFAEATDRKFDLICVSGVTLYVNDAEMPGFLENIKRVLQPWGLVFIRDLGLEKAAASVMGEFDILRLRREMLSLFARAGLKCVKARRAYPVNLPLKILRKWPCALTEKLWDAASAPWTYVLWEGLARLNLPHLRDEKFFFYLLQRP